MVFDAIMTPEQKKLRDEVREFVRSEVPRSLLIDMDADKVRYPKEYSPKPSKEKSLGAPVPTQVRG